MINEFYNLLINSQMWFFGETLMNDAFFSGILQLFNATLLLSLFYSVIVWPMRWCITALKKFIKGA